MKFLFLFLPLYSLSQDSTKYYWKQKVLYEKKMNEAIDRMNKSQNPKWDKNIWRLEDSVRRYEALLNKQKK